MPRFSELRLFGAVVTVLLAVGCGGGGPSGPGQPVISADAPPTGMTEVAYPGFTFSVTSGGAAPFTWSQTGALPPGMSFSPTGQLSGTPGTAATYPMTVMVSDSSTPPAGTVSYAYSGFLFSVASGGSPPFSWTVTTGSPPPGLTLGSDGSLSGTPISAGSFKFTVTVTDSASPAGTASQPVTVSINTPGPPVITPTPAPPAATVGSPYQYQFAATGGFLPLRWAITVGSLPPGLTLATNGLLTGTPMTTGSSPFTFTVAVTDSAPTPAINSAAFAIVVSNPPPPQISVVSLPTATVGKPYSYQFQATGGLSPFVWSETGSMPSLAVNLNGALSGTPTAAGRFPIMVDVKDALSRSAPSAPFTVRVSLDRPALVFEPTGSMTIPRVGHTATLLNNGEVLVTGGPNATAEIYNPATGMFTSTLGSMTEARAHHTATLLSDAALPNYGMVLILGSVDATAELYNPAAGTFAATHSMTTARTQPTATLLNSGKVLVAGGNTVTGDLTAELYDPATGTFTATGSMTVFRVGETATLLPDGRVLIAGGVTTGDALTATAELYNPTSGTFSATGMMTVAHTGHTATRLQDGTVLIVGTDPTLPVGSKATADLYDPATGTFTAVGDPATVAYAHTASLRSDGTVVVVGGYSNEYLFHYHEFQGVCTRLYGLFTVSNAAAALFAPESEGFTLAGNTNTARDEHTATVLSDGKVLIVGGTQHIVGKGGPANCPTPISVATPLSSAELLN
jgi:Putative Ig domain